MQRARARLCQQRAPRRWGAAAAAASCLLVGRGALARCVVPEPKILWSSPAADAVDVAVDADLLLIGNGGLRQVTLSAGAARRRCSRTRPCRAISRSTSSNRIPTTRSPCAFAFWQGPRGSPSGSVRSSDSEPGPSSAPAEPPGAGIDSDAGCACHPAVARASPWGTWRRDSGCCSLRSGVGVPSRRAERAHGTCESSDPARMRWTRWLRSERRWRVSAPAFTSEVHRLRARFSPVNFTELSRVRVRVNTGYALDRVPCPSAHPRERAGSVGGGESSDS
jgi:hypothetical protein